MYNITKSKLKQRSTIYFVYLYSFSEIRFSKAANLYYHVEFETEIQRVYFHLIINVIGRQGDDWNKCKLSRFNQTVFARRSTLTWRRRASGDRSSACSRLSLLVIPNFNISYVVNIILLLTKNVLKWQSSQV